MCVGDLHVCVGGGGDGVDVTLTQGVHDEGLTPVHQVGHQLEGLKTRGTVS